MALGALAPTQSEIEAVCVISCTRANQSLVILQCEKQHRWLISYWQQSVSTHHAAKSGQSRRQLELGALQPGSVFLDVAAVHRSPRMCPLRLLSHQTRRAVPQCHHPQTSVHGEALRPCMLETQHVECVISLCRTRDIRTGESAGEALTVTTIVRENSQPTVVGKRLVQATEERTI